MPSTASHPILAVTGLSRHFGGLRAVDDVSFEIPARTISTLIGPNGAGKSTLFNLISGLLVATSGSVVLNGRDVTSLQAHERQRAGIGRSFQITNLFFDLTVHENLRLAAQCLEAPGRMLRPVSRSTRAAARVHELVEKFGLGPKRNALVGQLSHGEQRRLEIAVCLAGEPQLLMLDEPTQGMSHQDTEETAALVRSLKDDVTILLVEHDIGLVMELSDQVIVMHQGRKLAQGAPKDVRENPAVQAAYFGH